MFGVAGQIEWANQQIVYLKSDLEAFVNDCPYFISCKLDGQTAEVVYRHTSSPFMPYDFSPRVGSVVTTLLSALDYVAVSLVRHSKKPPPKGKVYFPIKEKRLDFLAAMKTDHVINAMMHGSKALLRAAKPYKGRNDSLWLVHKLSNRVKHNDPIYLDTEFFLVEANQNQTPKKFDEFDVRNTQRYFVQDPGSLYLRPSPLGHYADVTKLKKLPFQHPGSEILRQKTGNNIPPRFEFAFRISLASPKLISGRPIIPFLQKLLVAVSEVVNSFYTLFD
jgi:hypothetical protein